MQPQKRAPSFLFLLFFVFSFFLFSFLGTGCRSLAAPSSSSGFGRVESATTTHATWPDPRFLVVSSSSWSSRVAREFPSFLCCAEQIASDVWWFLASTENGNGEGSSTCACHRSCRCGFSFFFFLFFVASCECLIIAPFLLVFRKLASRFPSPHVFRS